MDGNLALLGAILLISPGVDHSTGGPGQAGPRSDPFTCHWTDLQFLPDGGVDGNPPVLTVDPTGRRHSVFGGGTFGCGSTSYWCGLYHQMSFDGDHWTDPQLIPGTSTSGPFGEWLVETDAVGRLYVAWVGLGIQVCWSDDGGMTFTTPISISSGVPIGLHLDLQIDHEGSIHVAWDALDGVWPNIYWDIYYCFSTPTLLGKASTGAQHRDPVFYPAYAVSSDHFAGGLGVSLAVTPQRLVTIAWPAWDSTLRITSTRAGEPFPPGVDPGAGKVIDNPTVVADDDGSVTILYCYYGPPVWNGQIFSFVSLFGGPLLGPFEHVQDGGTLSPRRCARSGPMPGQVQVVWTELHSDDSGGFTYAESLDHGISFPHRQLIHDYHDYPGAGFASLALRPNGRPATIEQIHRYAECR